MRTVIIDDDTFFAELLSAKLYKHGLTTTNKFKSFEELIQSDICADVFFIDFHLQGANCNNIINYIELKYQNASIIIMSSNINAKKLLSTENDYEFFPKSKIKYLRFQIYSIKEKILERQLLFQNREAISIGVLYLFLFFSITVFGRKIFDFLNCFF